MAPKRRTLRVILRELTNEPFLPLLAYAELAKQLVQSGPYTVEWGVIAAVCTLLWVFSDAIDGEFLRKEIIGPERTTTENDEDVDDE